ncbi:MAG TPA: type V CRISPR-associated endonuclease Cas1 [Candidatus Absconditabacterales bacterium]|nr:type V CRISPR-associated endonuclease Cas1 [Candidatus Absconditabacterales bacterium]
MLSIPDLIEKQIVVLTSENIKDISLKNGNLLVKQDDKIINQISCHKIFCIFAIGDFTFTTKIIDEFIAHQISVYVISHNLKPRFIIGGTLEGNYLLRQKQYHADLNQETQIAKHIITNKTTNQLLLLKSIRDKDDKLKDTISKTKELIAKIETIESDDSLRGIEGSISKLFFSGYFKEIGRYRRLPRTRADIPNFLMDIGYTYLYNFIEANLNLYGFDVYKGIYHKLFYERKSLVCDFVEPFRSIVDHKIRKLYNLGQINEKDFKLVKGEYTLSRDKRNLYTKFFLETLMEYKIPILSYVKDYYRAIMNPNNPLPVFNFKEE